MANIIGGIICPNSHLSIKGSEYHGVINFLIFFIISDWFESFKEIYLIFTIFSNIIKYQWFKTIKIESWENIFILIILIINQKNNLLTLER